jgi:hypothetical protein
VAIHLTRAAALALTHWLYTVPESAIPVTDPSERQALADLLAQLETDVDSPSDADLKAAREVLLVDAGDWVHHGPIDEPANAG